MKVKMKSKNLLIEGEIKPNLPYRIYQIIKRNIKTAKIVIHKKTGKSAIMVYGILTPINITRIEYV